MKEGKEQYEIREEEPVKSGLGTYRIESQLLAAQQFHFEETSRLKSLTRSMKP